MDWLIQELRLAVRQVMRNPGVAAIVILTLGLTIGANTAIFSLVDAVLVKSLPYKDPSRLTVISEAFPQLKFGAGTFAAPDFKAFQDQQKSFEVVGALENREYELSGSGESQHVNGARVSSSVFPLLGVDAMLGRTFSPQEDQPGNNFVILSYRLWSQHFGKDGEIAGKVVRLDRIPYTVVGVMPAGFKLPLPGPQLNNKPADVWIPMGFTQSELSMWGGRYNYSVLGRLRPGMTLASASSEAGALAPRIQEHYPAAFAKYSNGAKLAVKLSPYTTEVVGNAKTLLLLLLSGVGLLLVIACSNLGALLLSRAIKRQKEMAVRAALGAKQSILLRQLSAENLVLALAGGGLGWLLAFSLRKWFLALLPASIPIPNDVEFSWAIAAFTVGLSLLACVLFGVAPAILLKHHTLNTVLRESGRSSSSGQVGKRMQSIFVAAEFGFAVILMIGAGLLLRSFNRLTSVNPGFEPEHVLTLSVPLPSQSYSKASQIRSFYQETESRIANTPSVKNAALTTDLPLHPRDTGSFFIEGRKAGSNMTPPSVHLTWILGDYLKVLQIRLLKGRSFTPDDHDGTQPVALVNATMARQFWPGEDVLGKRIHWAAGGPWMTIVGVVDDVKDDSLRAPASPHVYKPFLQEEDALIGNADTGGLRNLKLVVRAIGAAEGVTKQVEGTIHSLDQELAVAEVHTMNQDLETAMSRERFSALLISVFAGLAIFLAGIGVYGVMSFSVAQQSGDIGLRMALGAQKRDVIGMVLKKGVVLAAWGVAAGLTGAWIGAHSISSMLYEVPSTDLFTFISAPMVLIFLALLGAFIPAWRAARVDPLVALRCE